MCREVLRGSELAAVPQEVTPLLGHDVAKSTVEKYMTRRPGPPSPTWRAFLRAHGSEILACDFFTIPTATFRTLIGEAAHVVEALAAQGTDHALGVSVHQRRTRCSHPLVQAEGPHRRVELVPVGAVTVADEVAELPPTSTLGGQTERPSCRSLVQ